jgi:beta-galactosidase
VNIELWRDAGPLWSVKNVDVKQVDDSTARIVIQADLPGVGAQYSMTYTVHGTGDVIVEAAYQPGSDKVAMMPRFGTELVAAPGLDNLTWYGRGPVETYIDRRFERVGVYRSTVDKEWVEYMRPQENGNKTDVRWVALTNAQGVGLMAVGSPALGVSARRYSKQDMEQAGYTFPNGSQAAGVCESRCEADGRRRDRQLERECVSDGALPHHERTAARVPVPAESH